MNQDSLPEMREWLRRIAYSPDDLNQLNVIHVTGTKGKGSTCAFVSSILKHLFPEQRIGLFTSPHLKAVNERIQINSMPIPEEAFARYFWEVWDRLETYAEREGLDKTKKPSYFRFLTLMAWHLFMSVKVCCPKISILIKVNTAIVEVGIGGEYDSTNIIPRPTCTGVTSLGIDHVTVLGNTLESIAWHKGGIFKENVAALTVEQPAEALRVLKERALERRVMLHVRSLIIIVTFQHYSYPPGSEGNKTWDSWTSPTKQCVPCDCLSATSSQSGRCHLVRNYL
jgi:folylpolyglutamate synthase